MLDPDLVLAALLAASRANADFTTALGGSANVTSHQFSFGIENSLARAIYSLSSGSVLIAALDLIGGNWDGMTLFKHRFEIYFRPLSMAATNLPVVGIPCTPQHLWWLLMNKPIAGYEDGAKNIRTIRLLPDLAPVDAMPSLVHRADEDGADIFVGQVVIPELGDT